MANAFQKFEEFWQKLWQYVYSFFYHFDFRTEEGLDLSEAGYLEEDLIPHVEK